MNAAAELLASLARDGLQVKREGENLRVTPASRMTAEQRALIVAAKASLLALLSDSHATTAALIDANNAACAARDDDETNRLALLDECAGLDVASQLDLLELFEEVAALWRRAANSTGNYAGERKER